MCVEGWEEDAVTVVRNKRSRKGASKGGGPSKVRKIEGAGGRCRVKKHKYLAGKLWRV